MTSAPVYQDSQTGIISQIDPTTTYTNFYDSNGNFTHQTDIGQQAANGMPIIRDSKAGGTSPPAAASPSATSAIPSTASGPRRRRWPARA